MSQPEQTNDVTDKFIAILQEAGFCLDNPDVLHTPAQHREIIKGLVGIVIKATKDILEQHRQLVELQEAATKHLEALEQASKQEFVKCQPQL